MDFFDEVNKEIDTMEGQARFSKSVLLPSNIHVYNGLVKRLKGTQDINSETSNPDRFNCDNGTTIIAHHLFNNL